jgi:hypothetical protein
MRCDVSRLTSRYDRRRDASRLRRPDKNVDFPRFFDRFIATPERHDVSRIELEQSRRRDLRRDASRLRRDTSRRNFDVAMRRDLRRDSEKIQKT